MSEQEKQTIDLFTPVSLGPCTLPNRMVMAPMTRNRAADGNMPNDLIATHYRQRATAGLIITEGAQISEQGVGYPATPGIYNASQVAAWKTVVDAVHDEGGHIFLQLWHCGRVSHPSLQGDNQLPVAPSAVKADGEAATYTGMQPFVTPRALEIDELPDIITQYREASAKALAAGFDGVEIHAANGYLLDQFLRDGTNQRHDAYGGTLENRVRLLLEVTAAVVSVWGADRVGVRLSPLNPFNDMNDTNPEATFSYAVDQLNAFGLAYLHITEMGTDQPGAAGPMFDLHTLRDIWQGTYMTNFGYDKARGNAALAVGNADLIAFGVPYIANPDLVQRYATDAELNEADMATFYGGDEKGYTDYPALPAEQG
ncbi:MAG TPA: alkene reductase [Gammaproteobacteria bacterium]|nr:alkene reductase [Gammaproteobacteria bacterium]